MHSATSRALAVVKRPANGRPRLLHAVHAGRARGMLPWRATQLELDKPACRRTSVVAVLGPADYQLLLTESLGLSREETRAAIRWKIKDQISVPAEEAIIDTFDMPVTRGQAGSLQVVVVSPAVVADVDAMVRDTSCELSVVDIPELALRNLMALLPQDLSGCLFVLLGRSVIYILVSCLGVLYVARRIDAGLGTDVALLALEVQRSMQYYESQFDRAPIQDIVIGPDNAQARALAPQLADACGVGCEVLQLDRLIELDPGVAPVDQPELLLAVSAALRPGIAEAA